MTEKVENYYRKDEKLFYKRACKNIAKWGGCVSNWLGSLGTRVTSVYCIHWTIYCFLGLALICVLGDYISQWTIIPASILVLVASDLLSRLYVKFKKTNLKR